VPNEPIWAVGYTYLMAQNGQHLPKILTSKFEKFPIFPERYLRYPTGVETILDSLFIAIGWKCPHCPDCGGSLFLWSCGKPKCNRDGRPNVKHAVY
jgi:hypothetical protein